ncbi:efflux transporter outer membrane subunit [Parvularcula sp. LCG005]|uniref:efflux transporter outer membrane subunit n=1 Tax=Parvularcula sp. LCG005 TaxID=3078805 RepID=UPI002942F2D1|nr:efflux transporter outer membrane subunit [Parvularcula sp. LCG005]WOI54408.1 efflux transporter outer membrane subunit [Parvularcula sp. LCG005]
MMTARTSSGIAVALVALSACAVGPTPKAPDLAAPDRYHTDLTLDQDNGVAADVWWTGFQDEKLTALVEAALERNLDIVAAQAAVDAAAARQRAARGRFLPLIDGRSTASEGDGESSIDAALNLSYEIDLFGGLRRALTAASADLDTRRALEADERRLVAAAVASQYIELRRAGARLALLDNSLSLQRRTLEIVQARFDSGLSAALDVDRAAADLARGQAQRGLLDANRQNAAITLSVLTGEAPGGEDYGTPTDDIIPAYSGELDVGAPADLLRQRPDVRAAELSLVRELAQIGVAEAELWPQLSLSGAVGLADIGRAAEETVESLAALLDIPLFSGGRRRANVDEQRAVAAGALANYEAALLFALQDVESALVQINALHDRRERLMVAEQRSQSAYEQLDALYREGLASFIDVLDAQRTLISTRESVVENEAALANAIIALRAALGVR